MRPMETSAGEAACRECARDAAILDEKALLRDLEKLYETQRDGFIARLDEASSGGVPIDWERIARGSHDLAGTAPLFGDDRLAETSRGIERAIRRYADEARRFAAMHEQWQRYRTAA